MKSIRQTKAVLILLSFIPTMTLYLVGWYFNLQFIMGIFGLLFLFYYPGRFIIDILPSLAFRFGKFGRFSISVIYSFCLSSILGISAQKIFGFNSDSQIVALIMSNILLFSCCLLLPKTRHEEPYSDGWRDYIPLAIFACAIVVVALISPLAQNLDNYINIYKQSVALNQNLLDTRQIYISFFRLITIVLSYDITFVYRHILVILFFISTLAIFDNIKRNLSSTIIAFSAYLIFLASPAILIEINRTMPQVVLLMLTIPALILCNESLKKREILPSIVGIIISFISLLFHELSFILLLVCALTFIVAVFRSIADKKIAWKYLVVFLIITIPFIRLLFSGEIIARIAFRSSQVIDSIQGFHWQWWFLSNYKTVESIQLGWTGIGVVLYYLYNGLLLLIVMGYLIYLGLKSQSKLSDLAPALLYFGFFFATAELLPRLGIFFLPNRAWVHIMVATAVIIPLLLALTKDKIKIPLILTLISLVSSGSLGSLYLAKNTIYEVYKEEMDIAVFIRNNTENDALILSTQDNMSLVNIYGKRAYGQLIVDGIINKEIFDAVVDPALKNLSSDKPLHKQPHLIQAPMTYTLTDKNITMKAPCNGNNSVYFLYSYRKLGGLNDKREYRQSVIDSKNEYIYGKLGYPVAYSDKNALLIKLR